MLKSTRRTWVRIGIVVTVCGEAWVLYHYGIIGGDWIGAYLIGAGWIKDGAHLLIERALI